MFLWQTLAQRGRTSSATGEDGTCSLRLRSASLPLTQLPDESGRRSAIEDEKRLRKQLLRKEAGAPASIDLQPRGTNLVNKSRALASSLGSATAGPAPKFNEQPNTQ